MTKPPFVRRRSLQKHSTCRARTMAEVMGGTTAEMTVVGCCFPFAVVGFTFLTMYKVPTGLYRNARRKQQQPRLVMPRKARKRRVETQLAMHPAVIAAAKRFVTPEMDEEMAAFEDEMWKRFSESGFWRGPDRDD